MSHIEEYLEEKYKNLLPLDKKVPHRTFLVYNTWTNEVMVEKRVEKSKKSIYQKLQQVSSPHLAQIEEIVELDEDKKAAMVSNLLVVLCADEAAQPVVNTGTLNH